MVVLPALNLLQLKHLVDQEAPLVRSCSETLETLKALEQQVRSCPPPNRITVAFIPARAPCCLPMYNRLIRSRGTLAMPQAFNAGRVGHWHAPKPYALHLPHAPLPSPCLDDAPKLRSLPMTYRRGA